jgi:DNA-binding Lrp family transcriptional regulator
LDDSTTISSDVSITDKDRALLALLRRDARAPVADLARRLGVSRSTLQSRIERLERAGVIAGYAVRLGESYEAGQIRAHVMITAAPKLAKEVSARLGELPELRRLHSVSGPFDLIAEVSAPSVSAMDAVIDRIGALEGVERTQTSVILSTRFER